MLRKTGKHLHRHGKSAEQAPTKLARFEQTVDCAKDQRRPGHREQVRDVTGENMQKMRTTKHNDHAREKTRGYMQAPDSHPTEGECANSEDVKCCRPIYRRRERQNQK